MNDPRRPRDPASPLTPLAPASGAPPARPPAPTASFLPPSASPPSPSSSPAPGNLGPSAPTEAFYPPSLASSASTPRPGNLAPSAPTEAFFPPSLASSSTTQPGLPGRVGNLAPSAPTEAFFPPSLASSSTTQPGLPGRVGNLAPSAPTEAFFPPSLASSSTTQPGLPGLPGLTGNLGPSAPTEAVLVPASLPPPSNGVPAPAVLRSSPGGTGVVLASPPLPPFPSSSSLPLPPFAATGAAPLVPPSSRVSASAAPSSSGDFTLPPPLAPLAPSEAASWEVIGGYKPRRRLGQGGMATVYEAIHTTTGQRVALKQVKAEAREDPAFIERFLREVQSARMLDHPNICRIYAGGDDGRHVFMAAELIEGGDVDRLLQRMGGRLPAPVAALVITGLLEGLAHAHGRGMVHRDIKPANVMLTADGVVKIVDFGIVKNTAAEAKLTATGMVVGTPAYMSPEQARGVPVDGRSDLFSVGVMLIELLTGTNPFAAETSTATLLKLLTTTLPPLFSLDPTAPGVLQRLADGLLARDPAQRYPSAEAALADLDPYRRYILGEAPNLLADSLLDPLGVGRRLGSLQARFEVERAGDLLRLGAAGQPAAAIALFRAARLDPDDRVIAERLKNLCREAGFDFAPKDPRIAEVEQQIAMQANQPGLLKRAAELCRAARDPRGQADWLGRYLQLRGDDDLARRQWLALTVGPPLTLEPERQHTQTTREIVDGLKTGGWRQAPGPSTTGVAAALPSDVSPRPAPPTRPTGAVAEGALPDVAPVVVFADDAGPSRWRFVGPLAVALVGIVVAWKLFATSARETQAAFDRAGAVGNVDDRVVAEAEAALDRARNFIAHRSATDALTAAQVARDLGTLTASQHFEALFIEAQAHELLGNRARARTTVRKFLDDAPPTHRDYAAARVLLERIGTAP